MVISILYTLLLTPEETNSVVFLLTAEGAQRQNKKLQHQAKNEDFCRLGNGGGMGGQFSRMYIGCKKDNSKNNYQKSVEMTNEDKLGNLLKGSFFNTHIYPSHFLPSAD